MSQSAQIDSKRDYEYARTLIECLGMERIDYGLGLYAVLRLLAERAQGEGRYTRANIVGREIYKTREDRCAFEQAIALLVDGKLLGSFGEEGWRNICNNAAGEYGGSEYCAADSFKVVQYPHQSLDWRGEEIEEVENEIQAYVLRLRANLEGAKIDQKTVSSPSRTHHSRL